MRSRSFFVAMSAFKPRVREEGRRYHIGDFARLCGFSVHAIRWYEAQGLIPNVGRDRGGRRVYEEGHVEHLAFIDRMRRSGMPVAELRRLTELGLRRLAHATSAPGDACVSSRPRRGGDGAASQGARPHRPKDCVLRRVGGEEEAPPACVVAARQFQASALAPELIPRRAEGSQPLGDRGDFEFVAGDAHAVADGLAQQRPRQRRDV